MELVTIVQNGGPYVLTAVLAFLYWTERTERKEKETRLAEVNEQFLERMINSLNGAAQATRDMTAAMGTLNTTFQTVMFRLRERSGDAE